jgi:murein DD-endopeptidase MepM/ murein hydrolase activator NlpD
MAGVLDAFFPHMDSISERMQTITGRFADWGTSLRGSADFENFLSYAAEKGPLVGEAFGDMADAIIDLGQALGPFSTVILELLSYVADAISYVAENAPWAIQLIYGLWIATKLWTIAMASNPIGLVIMGLIGLALAVKYAWDHFEWFRDIVTGAWEGIQAAAEWTWTKVLDPVFTAIWSAIKWVGDAAVWLWKEVFVPVWNAISLIVRTTIAIIVTALLTPLWLAIQGVGLLALWLWEDCFKPTWDLIAWLAQSTWDFVLKPIFGFIWAGLKWVGDKFVWLYDHAVKPATDWIADKATWLWTTALRPTFGFIWDGVKWVGDKFRWLYDHGVKPSVDWIADKTDWLYEKGLKPAFDSIKTAVGLVGEAFEKAKDAIGIAWDKLTDITKRPVNFVIKWVYTKGIKAVWDKVASFVGLNPLPDAPKLLERGGTVGDGWSVAKPMKTNKPTAIVGEGNPRFPEYVIPTDPKYRSRALALHQQAGTQLLESGGIIGGLSDAWDWTTDTVSDVVGKGIDWAKTGADLLTNPSKIWNGLMEPILGRVADGVRSAAEWGKVIGRFPLKMATGLKDKIVNAVSGMFAGGDVGLWDKPVNAAFGTKFGVAGSMWASGHHTGLDFPAPAGTPVHAVADGSVTRTGTTGPYGNHVLIGHGGGLESLYAHLSKTLVDAGQHVARGQTIGRVGATGNVTGPHLHLEARVKGRPVDPMPYIMGGGPLGSKSPASAKAYAKSILGQFGWGPSQFPALEKLWEGESNWRWNAENPSSGAYGIPQSLPASKMASAGSDWRTNPATQIRWGLNYIKSRPDYGSPSAAYQKWLSRSPHWYDDGGYLEPGLNLVANGTGRPEPVFTDGQWSDIRFRPTSASSSVTGS